MWLYLSLAAFLLFRMALWVNIPSTSGLDTGFWYDNTRPPQSQYETLPYANLSVRLYNSYHDGPGAQLVNDPFDWNALLFAGNTIARQSFDAQFILDMHYALGVDIDRIFVLRVNQGNVHFSWESNSVIVNFVILERNQTGLDTLSGSTLLSLIANLTNDVQIPTSKVYSGTNITKYIDPLFGVELSGWDVSLQLSYSIEVIGENAVVDGYYLNQGARGICDVEGAANFSKYCEFERFFEDDISSVLNISDYRIQIMFIKKASFDAVLVHFRISPPKVDESGYSEERNISSAVTYLGELVADFESPLYDGNVTIRVDPLWGVSQMAGVSRRTTEARFTKKYYEHDTSRLDDSVRYSLITPYDRCKQNHRCNWGEYQLDQYTNDVKYFQRLFERGNMYSVNLFLDFEDWRMGSRGFGWYGSIPPTKAGESTIPMARASDGSIRGAHFWPFDQDSLGPDIPCYLAERNQGLVLDRMLQRAQIDKQEALVSDLLGRIEWLEENIEWADMGAELRSRKDVRQDLLWRKADFTNWWANEVGELRELNMSQCSNVDCSLHFNTTSLELTGAIPGTGVIRLTEAGTEVAVFSFNSIILGPEVKVTLSGQRAFSLVSKTTAIINTTIEAVPGTIGGMQGGGSVARFESDRLTDTPRDIFICDIGRYCNNGTTTSDMEYGFTLNESFVSNNVNGIGSGSLRVHPFVVTSSADDIREIQVITTAAQDGQTLAGGFKLYFNGYSTPIIPHDATSALMKEIIENNLNLVPPSNAPVNTDRTAGRIYGVGQVDVARTTPDSQEGFTWSITFSSHIGNMEEMTFTNYLTGLNNTMTLDTFQDGNEILGSFTLTFQGNTTEPIDAYETAAGLKTKLLALPSVSTAFVSRIDPTENCDDGLCNNGPNPARGMVWTCFVTTDVYQDNISPTSPTSPLVTVTAEYHRMTADISNLNGTSAAVDITFGTGLSPNTLFAQLEIMNPFSLAYGGAGASYGGLGGTGYSENPVGYIYNDDRITDLVGGSGGCMRGKSSFEINSAKGVVTGVGGDGGGAIEIVASNDIVIGKYGKLLVNGADGAQSTQGGGGGGSGGAVLIAAGGTVVNQGTLEARGGMGGFGGFENMDMPGGGGGGGRVALFGESVQNLDDGAVLVDGGACGAYKSTQSGWVLRANITMNMQMRTPLNDDRIVFLASTIINDTLSPIKEHELQGLTQMYDSSYVNTEVQLTVLLDIGGVNGTDDASVDVYRALLNQTIGVNIAEVVVSDTAVTEWEDVIFSREVVSYPASCDTAGSEGSFMTETLMATSMFVAETEGAEGTSRALYFSSNENTNTTSGSFREAPFPWNGPIVAFEASRPTRITYYTRMSEVPGESTKANFGALFSLLSRGEEGLDTSNVIGIFLGKTIMHGANFGTAVDEKVFLKRMVTIMDYPSVDKWYKIGIFINWDLQTYYVTLDDVVLAKDQPFEADDIDGIRLSTMRSCTVWYDEIYVGFDNTMNFMCPTTSRDEGTVTMGPEQLHWNLEELLGEGSTGYTEYNKMSRHYSHLDDFGSVLFDGRGLVKTNQDIKQKYETGDYPIEQGKMKAGAMNYLTNSPRSAKSASGRSSTTVSPEGLWYSPPDGIGGAGDGRQYWYTEYNYVDLFTETMNGGVMACSSQDMLSWRFEGVIFHYTNLTDMVYGSEGPFALERPKVKWNPASSSYVMWAVMDNVNRSLAMSVIATSPFEDGPFMFKRSFYPDGNQTRDQVIFFNEEGTPVLGRTYYQTVEFLQPEAVMQPVWESVKNRDGERDFRLNYQRAVYDTGYDNFHDIYYQRWRVEDVPYKVLCIDRLDSSLVREVYAGEYTEDDTVCIDPDEYKVVVGQGDPTISTNFISPASANNSWWIQTSVPAVKAQTWAANYRDGFCGVRVLDDNLELLDPLLTEFEPEDRGTCSNIADNPIHEHFADKLIGVQRVVASRRAKYMAVSELTEDLMDTTGNLQSFEGELDSGDLIGMIIEMGQFGFGAGDTITSTFRPPIRSEYNTAFDYATRFHQYINNYNDRATYSLGCVIDGTCPVNFRDDLTDGNL